MHRVQITSETKVVRTHKHIYMQTNEVHNMLYIHTESLLSNAYCRLGDGDKRRHLAQRCNLKFK